MGVKIKKRGSKWYVYVRFAVLGTGGLVPRIDGYVLCIESRGEE
jgi:hypothetical protein